jgi:endonuclease G
MRNALLRYYYLLFLVPLLGLHPTRSAAQATTESFDTGTKTDYATGTITLPTGDWDFTDALLGTDAADHKNGAQAVRIENKGKLTMGFYVPGGASLVTVQHATYGQDASSAWELWAQSQSCSCNNWSKVGATILTTSASPQVAAFVVTLPGSVRFEIRKVSGGAARLDFDDFTVTPYSAPVPPADNMSLTLGNPSGAVPDVSYPNNYLLVKPQYTVGYNRDEGKPNWVSWHLDISDRGGIDRQDTFRPDPALPADWYHVLDTDYQGSGFDRGHNCPSADRTNSIENNSATFLMSNMMPQAPNNNQKTWADLENYTRSFLPGFEAYVIAGSYGSGGIGSLNTISYTIANGKITVPSNTWKVVVLLPVGESDIARINASTRIIAVNMPNVNSLNSDWGVYRTSVDAIEAATGLDLLSALPTAVQSVVESKIDTGGTTQNP